MPTGRRLDRNSLAVSTESSDCRTPSMPGSSFSKCPTTRSTEKRTRHQPQGQHSRPIALDIPNTARGFRRSSSPPLPQRGPHFSQLSKQRSRKASESAPLVARMPSVMRSASKVSVATHTRTMEAEMSSLRTHVNMLRAQVEIEETSKDSVVHQVFSRWLIGIQEDEYRERLHITHAFMGVLDVLRTVMHLPRLPRPREVRRSLYSMPEVPDDDPNSPAHMYNVAGQRMVDLERRVAELEMELFSNALRRGEAEEAVANQCMEISRLRKQIGNQSTVITDLLKEAQRPPHKKEDLACVRSSSQSTLASHPRSPDSPSVKVVYSQNGAGSRSSTPERRMLPSQRSPSNSPLQRRSPTTSPTTPQRTAAVHQRALAEGALGNAMERTDTAPQQPHSALKGGPEMGRVQKRNRPVSISPEPQVLEPASAPPVAVATPNAKQQLCISPQTLALRYAGLPGPRFSQTFLDPGLVKRRSASEGSESESKTQIQPHALKPKLTAQRAKVRQAAGLPPEPLKLDVDVEP